MIRDRHFFGVDQPLDSRNGLIIRVPTWSGRGTIDHVHPRPIIVLGAERSGTSVVAEIVHRWGAYAGEPEDLPAPDPRNARGRWEFLPLWDVLAMLGRFDQGFSWWDEDFKQVVLSQGSRPDVLSAATALIERMERPGLPWMWKDPALCHYLPFWLRLWRRPVFVVAVRHPAAVARSWQLFAQAEGRTTSPGVNLLRWQWMTRNVLSYTESEQRLFLSYEALMGDPDDEVPRLAQFLDAAVGRVSTSDVHAGMKAACDATLWHQQNSEAAGILNDDQVALYALLRSMTHDPHQRFVDRCPMPPGWRETIKAQESATAPAPARSEPDR